MMITKDPYMMQANAIAARLLEGRGRELFREKVRLTGRERETK